MTETTVDVIALTVLADAPDSRGPFVLSTRQMISLEVHDRLLRMWRDAFERAGREVPPLIVLDPGFELSALPAAEGQPSSSDRR